MKSRLSYFFRRTGRAAISCLTVLVLSACGALSTRAAIENVPSQPTQNSLMGPSLSATEVLIPVTAETPTNSSQSIYTPAPAGAVYCLPPATLTPAVTEGPYFKAGSPERASLLDTGMTGVTLTLTGGVYTSDCKPVAHALLDFWQANSQGQYDNAGYTLRGHQYTDANGRFQLVTVVPGLYPGRTEHIHVKVQAPGGPVLTTQLFFPGVADNESDGIYNPALLIQILSSSSTSMQAGYNFIVSP